MPVLIGGAGALVGGILKGSKARKQKKEGRQILADNPSPEYNIPDEITSAAAEGLPSQQYEQAMKNIQRQQMTALRSSNERRGGIANIGRIQSGTNDATMNLDVADAQARQQNQRTLAQYKDKAWDWNKRQKFERNYDYGMNLLGAGNQNSAAATDQIVSGIGFGANALLGDGGGFMGFGGGRSRGGRRPSVGNTTYYDGYNSGSDYGDFVSSF